jgi:hypothetical protein
MDAARVAFSQQAEGIDVFCLRASDKIAIAFAHNHTDTNFAVWLAQALKNHAWFFRCFFVPTFAIVEGAFVLGVAEFPAMCCSEASANILFSFLRRPRSAGVFFISSRF